MLLFLPVVQFVCFPTHYHIVFPNDPMHMLSMLSKWMFFRISVRATVYLQTLTRIWPVYGSISLFFRSIL